MSDPVNHTGIRPTLPVQQMAIGDLPPLKLLLEDADLLAAEFASTKDYPALHAKYAALSFSDEQVLEIAKHAMVAAEANAEIERLIAEHRKNAVGEETS